MREKVTDGGGSSSPMADEGGVDRGARRPVGSSPNPKCEIRKPKEIRNPKSRIRSRSSRTAVRPIRLFSDLGFRPSFGFRISAFGFRGGGLPSRCHLHDQRATPHRAPLSAPAAPANMRDALWLARPW